MNRIQLTIPLDIVERLFERSKYLKHLEPCSTLILEIKTAMERGIVGRLVKGYDVSLTQSFEAAVDDLVSEDMEMGW